MKTKSDHKIEKKKEIKKRKKKTPLDHNNIKKLW